MILRHTFAGDQLTRWLRIVSRAGESADCRFTLDELDELARYVAAAANHTNDKKLKKHLAALFDRVCAVLASYTDEDD